jgi:hypothetical protein
MKPVAAQCKFDTETTWGWCSVEHHNLVQSEPDKWPQYQTRLLYTQEAINEAYRKGNDDGWTDANKGYYE